MRPHQWLKNILVFVPLLADQSYDQPDRVLASLLAFVAFSFAASAVYLINDLMDLEADRLHPNKRNRPFASGRLPLTYGPIVAILLLGSSLALSAVLLPVEFLGVLTGYLVLTTAYSLKLKGAVLIDVFLLAGLYTIRVMAGAAATGITPSMWLLAFSIFLFLSLALVKRYAELFVLVSTGAPEKQLPARSYREEDLHILVAMGTASGYLAVLVLALYIVSDEAARHYSESYLIWLICPLLLYWISRAWIVVGRNEMLDDPLVWAVRDQISRWVALIGAVIVLLAQ
jgi:4-hydroxybenzoate polyprenyltransferase